MIIRINIKLWSLVAFAVVIVAITSYLFLSYGAGSTVQPQLPSSVAYALEYFNAVNSNKTIIVPSAYYELAQSYMINNNKLISNDSEYAQILFNNKKYNNTNFVLIDIDQLDALDDLYSAANLPLNYTITVFPSSFITGNISNTERNCNVYETNTSNDVFAECQIWVTITSPSNSSQKINVTDGYVGLATFPNNLTYAINASVFYNGETMTYLPSFVNSSSSNFLGGVVFVYENLTTFYLPPEIMQTFYGSHMFLPNSTTNVLFDDFGKEVGQGTYLPWDIARVVEMS